MLTVIIAGAASIASPPREAMFSEKSEGIVMVAPKVPSARPRCASAGEASTKW